MDCQSICKRKIQCVLIKPPVPYVSTSCLVGGDREGVTLPLPVPCSPSSRTSYLPTPALKLVNRLRGWENEKKLVAAREVAEWGLGRGKSRDVHVYCFCASLLRT